MVGPSGVSACAHVDILLLGKWLDYHVWCRKAADKSTSWCGVGGTLALVTASMRSTSTKSSKKLRSAQTNLLQTTTKPSSGPSMVSC